MGIMKVDIARDFFSKIPFPFLEGPWKKDDNRF